MDASRSLSVSTFRRELAKAETIGHIKELRDRAAAVRKYCKDAKRGLFKANEAKECQLRAERKAGKILAATVNHRGSKGVGIRLKPTLPDFITKLQSHRWQRLASIPDDKFEQWLAEFSRDTDELTTACVMALVSSNGKHSPAKQLSTVACIERLREAIETIYSCWPQSERDKAIPAQLRAMADEICQGRFTHDM